MFYQASLFFDYLGFQYEASKLCQAIENGNLRPLQERVYEIAITTPPDKFVLRNYGYGGDLKTPESIDIVLSSPYRNAEIGQWLLVVMSTYLQPCPVSIGYNWKNLAQALETLHFPDEDIDKLSTGLPTSLLINTQASPQHLKVVAHTDPYWQWVRPLYTYQQGGWLPISECQRLLLALQELKLSMLEIETGFPNLPESAEVYWKNSVLQGYQDACTMLKASLAKDKGLYMVTLWQWHDED